jgi:Icc-related predicted phosphoesterase
MLILAKRKKMKLTFISDTHTKHNQITSSLPGGDVIIHAGDVSSMGYKHELQQFLKWFNGLDNYTHKIFIAGNHDWGFQDSPEMCKELLDFYNKVTYLQDDLEVIGEDYNTAVKIWGSPWQPEFYNWAFNLPRMGEELKEKWDMIPLNTDILVTHGPPWGHLDTVVGNPTNLGCELLTEQVNVVKPKIHVFGHIHSGYGYKFDGDTHYFNAAVLGEKYTFENKPMTVEWDPETNEIEFV